MARKKKKINSATSSSERWLYVLATQIERDARRDTRNLWSSIRSKEVRPAVHPDPPVSNREDAEMDDPTKSLAKSIAKLFNSLRHADTKIYIGEYELPAHAVILTSRSLYFEKALGENFHEGQTKQFHFKEESTMHAHWRVFEYMYTGNYSEDAAQEFASQDDDELVKDVRVYITADYFLMEDLKQHALGRFRSKLKQLLVGCIREIYAATTPETGRQLRDVMIDIVKDHRFDLWQRKAFRDLVHEGGDFAVELMGKLCTDQYL